MDDIRLTPRPALDGFEWHSASTCLRERPDLAFASLAIPLGGDADFAKALERLCELAVPGPRLSTTAGETRALRLGPDQLLLAYPRDALALPKLAKVGYVTDQSDVWVALELSGPDVRAILERICPLDISEARFPPGAFARTVMEHMGTLIVRTDEDIFLLLSASSSAGSFLHALETSIANVL